MGVGVRVDKRVDNVEEGKREGFDWNIVRNERLSQKRSVGRLLIVVLVINSVKLVIIFK